MAEYFRARGLPVPRELDTPWYMDWRRLLSTALVVMVLYAGFQIVGFDPRRINFE